MPGCIPSATWHATVAAAVLSAALLLPCAQGQAASWNTSTFVRKRLLEGSKLGTEYVKNHPESRLAPAVKPRSVTEVLAPLQTTGIAVFSGHDASIAISKNGQVQCVLELERLFEVRYYFPPEGTRYRVDWLKALLAVRTHCECDDGECPRSFEDGVVVYTANEPLRNLRLPHIVEEVFVVKRWRAVNHHEAHALLGYHSSPFRSALVLSYDGGGNDGTFNVYLGYGFQLELVKVLKFDMGGMYGFLGSLFPEVSGIKQTDICTWAAAGKWDYDKFGDAIQSWMKRLLFSWRDTPTSNKGTQFNTYAGKLMGYTALERPSPMFTKLARTLFEATADWDLFFGSAHPDDDQILLAACGSKEQQRQLAASVQKAFENMVHGIVEQLLESVGSAGDVEGIVVTGGCALNVLANQLIYDTLTAGSGNRSWPLGVHVPPASNDGGLTVGGLWAIAPPRRKQALQYLGFRLWDEEEVLEGEANRRGALHLPSKGGVEYLANIVANTKKGNDTEKPIVAVVRGRQEFGPRALGHRSLIVVPDSETVRDRVNRLKFREWYRPVAPMIADEALEEVFGRKLKSQFMTMAPRVREDVRIRFPALAHVDGTARHQSVGRDDEPWLHSLLMAVGKRTGLAALINTSFNTRGKPIVNTVRDCLNMLDTLDDLDYVLIGDWLFSKS